MQKNPNSAGKKQKVLCARKMKNWDFCRRNFDHSLEVFRSKYLTKGGFHLKKVTKFFFCTQKIEKLSTSFVRVFLKVWKFSAQSREVKKHFLWKKYQIVFLRTYLAVLRKQPDYFCRNFDEKRSGSEKKNWRINKYKNVFLHIFNAFLKTLLRTFLPKPQNFKFTVRKKPKSLGRLYQNVFCTLKMKKWDFRRWIFAHSLEVFCSKERNEKIWNRYRSNLLRTYLAALRKQPDSFCRNFDKKRSGSEKKNGNQQKIRMFPSISSMQFWKHC